jgi:hypothetical protein
MNEYQLGRQQTALEGPEHDVGAVKSVAFSPDGKLLVSTHFLSPGLAPTVPRPSTLLSCSLAS